MTEWEIIVNDKVYQILKILEGLNVWQAKKVIHECDSGIEANALVCLESEQKMETE